MSKTVKRSAAENSPIPEKRITDMAEITPEMQSKIALADSIMPKLDKLQNLVQAGWLSCAPGDDLIEALLHEITVLRSESLRPPIHQELGHSLLVAFAAMSEEVRSNLADQKLSVQQIRHAAFCSAVKGVLPSAQAHAVNEVLTRLKNICVNSVQNCDRAISYMDQHADLSAPAVAQNIAKIKGEHSAFSGLLNVLQGFSLGGLAPETALKEMEALRLQNAGVPPGATVN